MAPDITARLADVSAAAPVYFNTADSGFSFRFDHGVVHGNQLMCLCIKLKDLRAFVVNGRNIFMVPGVESPLISS